MAKLRRRIQLAELGRWDELIGLYEAAVDERAAAGASVGPPRQRPPVSDIQGEYDRVIRTVKERGVSRAMPHVEGVPRVPRDEVVAEAMARLAAIPASAGEYAEVIAKFDRFRADPAVVPLVVGCGDARRTALALDLHAAPGPSGWRNGLIVEIAAPDGGVGALAAYASLSASAAWSREDAVLWGSGVLGPIDQGASDRPDAARGRKLRGIALLEHLIKFAESAALAGRVLAARRRLEPVNLGLTPDGCPIVARTLRGWARRFESPAPGQSPEAIVKLDLKNAYGAMLRSVVMQVVFNAEPTIALLLFVHRGKACNTFWQKVGDEWRRILSWRGGGAGSRLIMMQLAFLFHAARMVRGVLAAHMPERPGDALATTGIADDWYLAGAASSIVQVWPRLRSVAAAGGHALTDSKCGCWFPGLDKGMGEPDSATARLEEMTRRSRGGMHVLGTALRGDTLDIDAEQCGVGPAAGRAARAARLCERLRAFVGSCTHDDTRQAAWAILAFGISHLLGHDIRMCPPRALSVQVLGNFCAEIASAAAAIIGTTLAPAMAEQLALPIFFGGFAVNVPRVDNAAAGFWSSWVAAALDAQRVALLAGLPFQVGPDMPAAIEARDVLAASGVVADAGRIELEPGAAARYAASPWVGDLPVQELFTFARDAEDAQAHALDPDRSALATFARGLGRGPAAPRAADLVAALPHERAANLLDRGGRGAGLWWSAAPAPSTAWIGNRRWLPTARRRLGAPVLEPGQACAHCYRGGPRRGQPCGRQLDISGVHAARCMVGPFRVRWHNDIKIAVAAALRKAGAIVEVESHILELYQTDRDDGVKEAILDVCWRWPAGVTWTWLDVTVHSYPDGEARAAARDVHLATRAAERSKRQRYGDRVAAFAVGIGGRLGEDALAILRQIDVDAASHAWATRGLPAPPPSRAMLAAISAAVVAAEAEAILGAIAPLPPREEEGLRWPDGAMYCNVVVEDVGARLQAQVLGDRGCRVSVGDIVYKDFAEEVGESTVGPIIQVLLKSVLKTVVVNAVGKQVGERCM
ncbi:unnamed protein product [Prorocentrum cordatum]|uniref:RNA-directed RNA polymerase n=1 Tax=Prorocentrum cordatum TaxID=2364126 RepID=A0ABN9TA21_9DINO|nr:unnamed protein product [Polarella glacialis]